MFKQIIIKMKKVLSTLLIAGVATLVACGPSAKEKAEKARQDSIRIADSIAQVEADKAAKEQARLDSIAKVENEKRIQDSLAQIEANKKKAAPVKKKDPVQDAKKVGGGRRS